MTPESRVTEDNPNSPQDYRPGGRPPFVYKSGPDWPNLDPEFRPAVAPDLLKKSWSSLAKRVMERLASCNVKWRSLNLHAFGNEGEVKPFCPFIVCIGVNPNSLPYKDAVRAADAVKEMLADAGWPEVEVGFMEVTFWGGMAASSRSANETRDNSGGDQARE